MDIKSNLTILAEAAASDIKANSSASLKLDTVKEAYGAIPTINEPAVTEAADVIVNDTRDGYYVEMVNLAPFMMDSGIKSISKALDIVAEANGLEPKTIGLVVDSQANIEATLEAAQKRAKETGNYKLVENAISKVNKNNVLIKRLLSEGYKVAKKSEDSKVCPKCGKAKCKCECGGSCSGCGDKAVIAEEKEKTVNEGTNDYSLSTPIKVNNKSITITVRNDSDLSDDEAKTLLTKHVSDVMPKIKEFIKNEWSGWMDMEYSEKLANEIIADVFDFASVTQFKDGKMYLEYMLNNMYTSHKYSKAFFGAHTLTATCLYDNGKFKFKNCGLEG